MNRRMLLTALWIGVLLVGLVSPAQAQATISGVSPAEGTVGTQVTITGSGFGQKHGEVLLGTEKCRVLAWSDTEITFLVDKPQRPDEYAITVLLQGDKKPAEPLTFEAFALRRPRIDPEGLLHDGATATIVGAFFGDKKGTLRVGYLEGGAGGELVVEAPKILDWSMNTIRFELPEGLTGEFVLAVRNEVGASLALLTLDGGMPGSVAPIPDWGGLQESWENASGIYFKGKFYVFANKYNPGYDDNWRIGAWTFDPSTGAFDPIWVPKGETEVPLQPLVVGDTLWVFHTGHRWSENICCVPMWYTTYTYNESTQTGTWDPAGWKEIPGKEMDEKATLAPVYDPRSHRISVYSAHDGRLRWFYSDDFGAHWSVYVIPAGGMPSVSGKFVHAIYWPSETTTALVASTGQVWAFQDCLVRKSIGGAPGGLSNPFLVDLGGGKVTVLYRAADNTPMMTNLDYETSSWSAPTQPVYLPDTGFPGTSYSFAWSPRGAINQVPKTGEYDRHLYIFYGVHFWEMYTDEGWYEWYMHDEGILGP